MCNATCESARRQELLTRNSPLAVREENHRTQKETVDREEKKIIGGNLAAPDRNQ